MLFSLICFSPSDEKSHLLAGLNSFEFDRVVSESKRASEGCSFALAERKGFEPLLEDYSKHDFQSCALDQLSHLSVQVAIRRRVGRTPATCVFYHTSQDLSRGFPKNAEKKLTVDRNLLYSRSVLAPCGSPGRFRLTGMPVAPTAMAQNFLSGNVFPDLQPARSRKETHSGVGSAVLPLRVRTRVRFFCAGAR